MKEEGKFDTLEFPIVKNSHAKFLKDDIIPEEPLPYLPIGIMLKHWIYNNITYHINNAVWHIKKMFRKRK